MFVESQHLTHAIIWPTFLRYVSTLVTHYFPLNFVQLPSQIQEYYRKVYGETASSKVITHCKRELMQKIWERLLDEEFMKAHKHGIKILCSDNIWRLFFPRFLTYSADYPEK